MIILMNILLMILIMKESIIIINIIINVCVCENDIINVY